MNRRRSRIQARRGAIAPLTAMLLVPLLGLAALAVDVGYLALVRSQLQNAADAAAMAAAKEILTNKGPESQTTARTWAREFGEVNHVVGTPVIVDSYSDVTFGYWNTTQRKLEAARMYHPNVKVNGTRVVARYDAALFFARVFGIETWDVAVESIAYAPYPTVTPSSVGRGTRFLIDDDMFDTDEPSIIALANTLRMTPDRLLSAKDEKSPNPVNWFLNIPAGSILNLPTGQVGDEGLLDIAANESRPNLPQYPLTNQADHTDFLKYNETSESDSVSKMRYKLFTDSELDPLRGVGRFNQPSRYPELVNPSFIHVSPVYKSDVSALDGVAQANSSAGPDLNNDGRPDGNTTNDSVVNGVNAKGYRRGLVAFKIIGYNLDRNHPYPTLPRLTIQIVDPATINLNSIPPIVDSSVLWDYKAGGVKNVRLVQ